MRGSADFITLGVHTSPPPDELLGQIEYKQLPNPDDISDDRVDRVLKLGFETVRLLDQLDLPWWP